MKSLPTADDIRKWFPRKWSEFAGNSELISVCKKLVQKGPSNLLVTGSSRTGKTRTVKHMIKAILCSDRDENLDPCNKCVACLAVDSPMESHTGLFREPDGSPFHFAQIDCHRISAADLKQLPNLVEWDDEKLIVYLDEVGELGKSGKDGQLLKPTEDWRCVWIASCVSARKRRQGKKKGRVPGLSAMVRARFPLTLGTARPQPSDLVAWCKARAADWSIEIEEPDQTLRALAEVTECRVGMAKHPFVRAALEDHRTLTKEAVARFPFDSVD